MACTRIIWPNMNSVSECAVEWLWNPQRWIGGFSEFQIGQALSTVCCSTQQLTAMLPTTAAAALSTVITGNQSDREPKIPASVHYGGEMGDCCRFLTQCVLVFKLQLLAFPTEHAKVAFPAYMTNQRWGTVEWAQCSQCFPLLSLLRRR